MSQAESAKAFSFSDQSRERQVSASVSRPVSPVRSLERVADAGELERIRRAMHAVDEVAYHWVIESDEIAWSSNADEVLGCPST